MNQSDADSSQVLYTSPGVSVRARQRPVPTQTMVNAAIRSQMATARRGRGVSLAAIKKYIAQNYLAAQEDLRSRLTYVKRYIAAALQKGKLVRTTGTGVSGSFRLAERPSKSQAPKKVRKAAKPKTVKARRRKAKVPRTPGDQRPSAKARPDPQTTTTTTTTTS